MKFIKIVLTGIGQIFLQENGLSGLLITIAMFFSHWTLGVGCFLGALIGTLTAQILKFPANQIQQGLYGFNASLAFMCTMFTFGLVDASNPVIWLLAVVASVVSTLIMRLFLKHNKVAFTFPFVLTCWVFCWAVAHFHLFGLTQTTPALPDYTQNADMLAQPFFAWAEVNFGSHLWTGVLIFVAIAINAPAVAMWATAVTPISALLAHGFWAIPANELANGLYGFSPILVACVFAGSRLRDFVFVMLGVVLAIVIQYAVAAMGLATYTFGFIAASWIMLAIKSRVENKITFDHKVVNILNP